MPWTFDHVVDDIIPFEFEGDEDSEEAADGCGVDAFDVVDVEDAFLG